MAAETKDRILEANAALFMERGYNASGIKQVADASKAPFGSIYHFFPGVKEELGAETIRLAGNFYEDLVTQVMAAEPDPVSAVEACFTGAAQTLIDTDYADACPIATVALEVASTNEPLRQATADVFEHWIDSATKGFELAGIATDRARDLAFMMLSLLEGGFLFSRAMRDTESLAIAGRTMAAAVRAELDSIEP
jgi:AcrR family transcriptional regulator